MEIIIDFIRGFTIGFEYIDDYDEGDNTYFLLAIHLFLIRIILQWQK